MKFKSTLFLIIAALVAVIFILQCDSRKGDVAPSKTTVVDTTWVQRDSVIIRDSIRLVYEKTQPVPQQYQPSEDCDTLSKQYAGLSDQYFRLKVYSDTVRFDSSYIVCNDSVSQNTLIGGGYYFNLKTPTITIKETITKQAPARRQLYYGINLAGNQNRIQSGGVGVLYKNRKDQITGIEVKYDLLVKEPVYQLSHYRKISFRK